MTSKGAPPVTLIAGGKWSKDFGTSPYLGDAFRATGKPKPTVVQIGAANGDDRAFGTATVLLMKKAGAGEVLWPRVCGKKKDVAGMKKALETADVVFVSGGDVEEGMNVLEELELVKAVTAAAKRGAVFVGISAGAIMIGERWVRWPSAKATDDEAETFACLGVAGVSIDTHGEKDGWGEVKSFVAVRARETGQTQSACGVPSGAALIVEGTTLRAAGSPVQVFRAKKGHAAEALADLPVKR
jgi:cyanophycinase-like exopeptidase